MLTTIRHGGERIDPESPIDNEIAHRHPLGDLDARRAGAKTDLEERHPRKRRRHKEESGRDDFAGTRPEKPPEQACDEEADERQEDDCVIHVDISGP